MARMTGFERMAHVEREELRVMDAEANAFAMELLMPEAWIKRDAAAIGDLMDEKAIKRLAARYRVDPWVMMFRLGMMFP